MTHIVLVRPGATDFDDQGRIKGTLDIPLSDNGREQVASLAEQFAGKKVQAVYAGPCQAAAETARAIAAATHAPVRQLASFQNLDHGLWAGLTIAEVKHRQPKIYRQWQDHPETVCPPQGESLNAAQDRVRAELEHLIARHPDGVVVLVVPEPLASIVRSELGGEVGDLWEAECRCGSFESLEVEGLPVKT